MPFRIRRGKSEQRIISSLLYGFPFSVSFLRFKNRFADKLSVFNRNIIIMVIAHAAVMEEDAGILILLQIIKAARFSACDSEAGDHFTFIRISITCCIRMRRITVESQHFLIPVSVKIIKRKGWLIIECFAFVIIFRTVIICFVC